MRWPQQLEIIIDKYCSSELAKDEQFVRSTFAKFLGISTGKAQAWERGQRPSADDLETISRKLGFSPHWLLLGEGEPFDHAPQKQGTALSISGGIAGDMLFDILLQRHQNLETAAQAIGISFEELDGCIGRAPAPEWDVLQKLAEHGVNINYLLTGEGLPMMPQTEIERAMLAVGAKDAWEMASHLGIDRKEIDEHIREAKEEGMLMPNEWHDILMRKYGLNHRWTSRGEYPSHTQRPQTDAIDTLKKHVRELEDVLLGLANKENSGFTHPTGTDHDSG